MTIEDLKELKNKDPFEKFTIHMADGKAVVVDDPEDIVFRRDWTIDLMILRPRGHFTFVYLKNVTHITSEGKLPKFKRRRSRNSGEEG